MGVGRGVRARNRSWRARSFERKTSGGHPASLAPMALVLVVAASLVFAGPVAKASSLLPRGVPATVPETRAERLTAAPTAPSPPSFVLDAISARSGTQPRYRLRVVFPEVTGLSAVVAARINWRIDSFVGHVVASFEHETKAAGPPYPHGRSPSRLVGSVTTDFDSARVISVSLAEYTLPAGAAHGTTAVTTFNFDARTGQPYRLADLFVPSSNWLVALSRASRRALPKLVGSLSTTRWLDSGTAPKASNFAAWSLTPWGLQITFGDYQVAAYGAGMPQVTIPYASLSGFARKTGPIALAVAGAGGATSGPGRMPLLPAVSPPASGECYRTLSYTSGLPQPFTCPGGRINVAAWDRVTEYVDGKGFAGLRLLTLTAKSSVGTVRSAMCSDLGPGPYTDTAIVVGAERLVAVYYAWRFKASPATGFPKYCHGAT